MSLAGKLEDVPLADVMQFIHLGRRTGTLSLDHASKRAEITFHNGAIVGAWSPSSKRIGELLTSEGLVTEEQVEAALESQQDESPRRSLGQILLATGIVTMEDVREAVKSQIERTIYELVTWTTGSFVFELDTLKPVDDIAVYPGDVIPDIDLNTQMVLLEAARIFDERVRDETEGLLPTPPRPEPPTQKPVTFEKQAEAAELFDETGDAPPEARAEAAVESVPDEEPVYESIVEVRDGAAAAEDDLRLPEPATPTRPVLQLIGDDDPELEAALAEELDGVDVRRVEVSAAGVAGEGQSEPVIGFQLGRGTTVEELATVCRERGGSPVICILEDISLAAAAYQAGVAAVVPAEPVAIAGCFKSMARFRRGPKARPSPEAATSTAFAKLRRVVADLRSGVFSATVALNLMNVIGESVERAVLFLVKRDSLSALGAFGFAADGRPLAEATRGLEIPVDHESALTAAMEAGRALSLRFDEADLPPALGDLVGRPKVDQVVVFPVLGSDRVILVIYTDNGPLERPIEEIDILDLAAAEVGIAFENELLRRQLGQR